MSRTTAMLFAHICNSNHMTGAEKLLLFLIRELSASLDCILVVPNEGMLAREARGSCRSVIVHPYPLAWSLWSCEAGTAAEAASLLQSEHIGSVMNLIHMHRPQLVLSHTCVNLVPAAAAKRLGVPVLWTVTETICETVHTPATVEILHRYSDWIMGISHTTLGPFHRQGLAQKLYLCYPSWRQEELQPHTWAGNRQHKRALYGLSEEDALVGFLASDLVPHKGLEHFISMAVGVCQSLPRVHFLIAGNPTEPDFYERCVRNIHLSGYAARFILEPFGSRIETLYPALDIMTVPSLIREGFGMTALEGMIFGKPVAAYKSGALGEVLGNIGKSHLLAEPGDISGLASIVHYLSRDLNNCRAEGASCQLAVHEMFGLGAYRSRLGNLLQAMEPGLVFKEQVYAATRSGYPEGSLVKGTATPAVFLIQNRTKRPFANEAGFYGNGFGWHQVRHVDDAELQAFPTGVPIYG
ncbi:glycosyltransferase family 4 protein [Gorillibacterium sp. sgz5001074]|uniref:glycosyltransferase family 4 protein n=1 Tax=Gorillibacterium sp. sgz5001074 TaxID=3446695 RepID=UPI003F670E56